MITVALMREIPEKARLILVPTPLSEGLPLEPVAQSWIQWALEHEPEQTLIVVEEPKISRKRWVQWGFSREWIGRFIVFNEQTSQGLEDELLEQMKHGKRVFLMSDGGLPGFCDPGQGLIRKCHEAQIVVTATPFPNSLMLALVLSGFSLKNFVFAGFPPQKAQEREQYFKKWTRVSDVVALMDTPYRLEKTLQELQAQAPRREIFCALELNSAQEELHSGTPAEVLAKVLGRKQEFVVVLNQVKSK